jgi:hypothetical protein
MTKDELREERLRQRVRLVNLIAEVEALKQRLTALADELERELFGEERISRPRGRAALSRTARPPRRDRPPDSNSR